MTDYSINEAPPGPAGQTLPQIPPPPMAPWGFHGMFDCDNCDLDKLQNKENIQQWVQEIVTSLGWQQVGILSIDSNGDAVNATSGYILYQSFNKGTISAHVSDINKQIYVDIFSYTEFAPNIIDASLVKYFGDAVKVRKILMPRNAAVGL